MPLLGFDVVDTKLVVNEEHEAIVDAATFERVQNLLHENGGRGCGEKRNKHGALLRGLLRCSACDCVMTHTYTSKRNRRYRYYVCNNAQQLGRRTCPAPSVSAEQIEQFVVDEIRAIGRDPALVAATLAESRRLADEAIQRLKRERAALERQRRANGAEHRQRLADDTNNSDPDCFAEVQERMAKTELRFAEVEAELASSLVTEVDEDGVAAALTQFDDVWATLAPKEQARVLGLLIERVDYDGQRGDVTFAFRASGLKGLPNNVVSEETAA
jgi:site-specific DNA recombinase